jgi:hypothetical protein
MKKTILYLFLIPLLVSACRSSKTYFTAGIRSRVEANQQALEKIQFYADRDIVLRRDMETGETKVTSGKVKMENGHYVNIVTLPKNTPGVCTFVKNNIVGISFETGDNRFLTFGKTKNAQGNDPYRILANDWVSDYGVINYDGKKYHIQSEGTNAALLIKTKLLKKYKVEERIMKGRTVSDHDVTSTGK